MTGRRSFLAGGACAAVCAAVRPFAARAADALPALPEYYAGYLPQVAARINALKQRTDDGFFFLTDLHIPANRKRSGQLIADLIGRTRLRNVYCGGDFPQAYGADPRANVDATMADYLTYWANPIVSAGGILYTAKGNHDFTIRESSSSSAGWTYSSAVAHDFLMASSPRPFFITNAADPEACYGWRDAPHARIRYIVADTCDSVHDSSSRPWGVGYGMRRTQLEWIADQALGTVPAGWGVVFIYHIPTAPVVGYESKTASYNFQLFHRMMEAYQHRGTVNLFGTTRDYSSATGRILFCLEGHHHHDRFSHLNGILHVCEACDAAYADYILHTPFSGTLPSKDPGTIYEQTFDVLQIDPVNGLLYTTRIGGGQDRVFHTNVVRVPAGNTFRFSAPNLSGALSWACYDGDQSVHDTTARTPEGFVTLFNEHALSVDADGTLHAGTPGSATVLAMDADYRKEVYCVQVV